MLSEGPNKCMQLCQTKITRKDLTKSKKLHISWFLDNKAVSSDKKETFKYHCIPPSVFQFFFCFFF